LHICCICGYISVSVTSSHTVNHDPTVAFGCVLTMLAEHGDADVCSREPKRMWTWCDLHTGNHTAADRILQYVIKQYARKHASVFGDIGEPASSPGRYGQTKQQRVRYTLTGHKSRPPGKFHSLW